ncbi:YheU family protein [Alcanivorax sp. DP30]|uniref:YheU family protein n=1 Tax=Alcanivorax sp. DP30 TaxID=2606217 RepID=UPI001369DBFF|nr:YheU family protein [Alcanivorax sp. DP30]MZR62117.1 YheU family protein [Alcanivorax sp. DP30]
MPLIVPWKDIPADTLDNLIEEFVTRDGTDYGDTEIATSTKVEQVRRQLKTGDAFVVFDEATESVSVMGKEQADEAINS